MPAQVHQGDIGTIFRLTVKDESDVVVDISGASTKQIFFRKPDNSTVLTKSASFTTSGTDGKMQWTSIAGDLDTVGDWTVQGYVVLASGTWKTSTIQFKVYPNLA